MTRASKRPTIRERAAVAQCPNCGKVPERKSVKGVPPTYCSKACKDEFGNRLSSRGKAIAGWAMAWRVDRGSGEIAKGAFQQLCSILDLFNAEDIEAARPRICGWASKM